MIASDGIVWTLRRPDDTLAIILVWDQLVAACRKGRSGGPCWSVSNLESKSAAQEAALKQTEYEEQLDAQLVMAPRMVSFSRDVRSALAKGELSNRTLIELVSDIVASGGDALL